MTIDPFAMLRFLDDAGLDVYQHRLMTHYWRRGECWEKLRTTASECSMSLGKASETRQWLLDNDYIEWATARNGDLCIVVSVRVANICNGTDVDVHYANDVNNERSPDEQNVHHMNADVHHMNAILNNKVSKPKKKDIYPPTPVPIGLVSGLAAELFEDEPFDAEEFDRETARQEMAAAISVEVREIVAPGKTPKEVGETADILIAAGYKPEDVRGFYDWWKDNGWYKNDGRPSAEHLRDHLKDFQAGVCLKSAARASPNGHGKHDKKPLYEPDENGIY